MAFIRKVKTTSGAIAVQIAHKEYGRIVRIEHIGSAHNETDLGLDAKTCSCDANGDGFTNMGDVTKIERIILRLDP